MRSFCGQLATVAALSGAWAAIVCQDDFEGVDPSSAEAKGGRKATDQRLGARFEKKGHAHLLCEGVDKNGTTVQSTAEFRGANIGFKSGWQSANPYGEVRWELTDVNGQQLPEYGDISIPGKYSKYLVCGDKPPKLDGQVSQFSDAMVLENKLQPNSDHSATITALAFLNDDAKSSVLEGEAYSIEQDMGGCKLEMMVKVPVNADGDTTFTININFHKDEGEAALNAGLTARNENGMIVIDSSLQTSDGSKTALSMASSLICVEKDAATGKSLSNEDVTISDLSNFPKESRSFTYTIPKEVTEDQKCYDLYWDPGMTPFTQDQEVETSAVGPESGLASLFVLLSVGMCL